MFVSPPPIPASYSEDVKPEWLQINSVKPLQSAGHLGNICLMPERSGCCVKVRCLFISSFFFFFSWSEAFLSALFSKVQDFWQISTPRPSEPHLNLRSVCVWRVCGYDRVCVCPRWIKRLRSRCECCWRHSDPWSRVFQALFLASLSQFLLGKDHVLLKCWYLSESAAISAQTWNGETDGVDSGEQKHFCSVLVQ